MKELENIKVGDNVLSKGKWGDELEFVTKVTKTQIITNVGRYKRDTGRLISADAWSARWIKIPTQEDYARIQLDNLRNTLTKRLEELCGQVENMDEETITKLLGKLHLSK